MCSLCEETSFFFSFCPFCIVRLLIWLLLCCLCAHTCILQLQYSYSSSSWSLIYSSVISCLMGITTFLSWWKYDLIASSSNCCIVYTTCYESIILLRPLVLKFRFGNSNYCCLLSGPEMRCSIPAILGRDEKHMLELQLCGNCCKGAFCSCSFIHIQQAALLQCTS